jgi:exonuclease SbcC
VIILELEIRDFKQYRGTHLFTPPETGVIGIVGPNGAGKTTLFEAIEWCLYQKNLKADEIPPRSMENPRPQVRILLASTRSTEQYEITRGLTGSGATRAEVRRLDGDVWTPVVSGSTAALKYVAQSLIGLEYKAFVATFFTRQKELNFFGSLSGLERRREVNRLLGLETIRRAQERIAEDRRTQRAKAEGLLAAFQQQTADRDFDAEQAALEQQRAEQETLVDQLLVEVTGATAALRDATRLRDELEAKRASKLELDAKIASLRGAIAQSEDTIRTASAELAVIDALEKEAAELRPVAVRMTSDAERVQALEGDREAFERRKSLETDVRTAAADTARLESRAEQVLESANLTGDRNIPIGERLAAAVKSTSTVDTSVLERRARAIEQAMERSAQLERELETLEKYHALVREITARREELVAELNAFPAALELDSRRVETEKQLALGQGTIEDLRKSIALHEEFVGLDVSTVDRRCPTCGRPVSEHELEDARKHVGALVADLEARIAEIEANAVQMTETLRQVEKNRTERAAVEDRVSAEQARLDKSTEVISRQETVISSCQSALQEPLDVLGQADVPSAADLEAVKRELEALRLRQQTHLQLVEVNAALANATATLDRATSALDSVPVVAFDPDKLTAARAALDESRRAESRLDVITRQIGRRAEWETSLKSANEQLDTARPELAELEAASIAVGFDPGALDEAKWTWDEAQQKERAAIQNRDRARNDVLRITDRIAQIKRDRDQLGEIKAAADRARVQVDDLSRMYDEFNRFEQYVARKVRPQLEEITSELVRAITEGKYDGVQLDDDYGITVEDGEHGYFPIASFSGGERDVISLAARLALSRLIGSQAANPPSFLVLDEVFGSLDRDRRQGVLELLNTLSGSADAFQQLFVISHDDEVRLSPAFTDIWRVVEDESGYSRLENMSQTGGFEDL